MAVLSADRRSWLLRTLSVAAATLAVVVSHSGRAVVFTIWQASHMDQAYFFCSDVVIS